MSETTAEERPPQEATAIAEPDTKPASAAETTTPVWVWIVYTLGGLSAVVLVASLVFVVLASVGNGGGVEISVPGLVVWLAIAIVALATFVRRRSRRPR